MAPLEQRQERLRHFQQAEEVDREVLFKQVEIAQIVVDGNARIVDEDVERFDPHRLPAGSARRWSRPALGASRACPDVAMRCAFPNILFCAASERLIEKRPADAAVRAGNQDGLVRNVHDLSPLNRDLAVPKSTSLQISNGDKPADIKHSLSALGKFTDGALQRGERASAGQYGIFASASWPVP